MAVDVEDLWLQALDAQDEDDRDEMCRLSDEIIDADPEHGEAWWMRANLELPQHGEPNLREVSRCLRACRKSIEYDPENRPAWWRGGQILVQELGMLEEALVWWQLRREVSPTDPEPLIEQVAILADLGQYAISAERLNQLWAEGMDAMAHSQLMRTARLHETVKKAAEREKTLIFRPWEKDHPGWKDIEFQRKKKPASEQLTFLMLAGPIVMSEVFLWNSLEFSGSIWIPMISGFLLVVGTVLIGVKWSKSLTRRLNRPAYNVIRATDVEMSSGKTCFPNDWRPLKLYQTLLKYRTTAFQERLEKVVEAGEPLPKKWKPDIPDMTTVDLIFEEE
jgi:hypothetical protein